MSIIEENNSYIFNCPHCNQTIIVFKKELNCCIFRHGIYKDSYKQINPHMNKINCDNLVKQDKIIGCGKPFKIIKSNPPKVEICDYI